MTVVWGVNYVAAKISLRYFPPLLFAPLRSIFAALMLAPVYLITKRGARGAGHAPWTRGEIYRIVLLGIAGITFNQLAFILGMSRTSVAHAALIIATTPVLVLLMAAARGLEHITGRKAVGLAVSLSGILVLNLAPARAGRGASLLGDFFIFLAAFFFAAFTVGSKEMTRRHGPVVVNAFAFLAGAAASMPLLHYAGRGFPWAEVPPTGWLAMVYMALFPSVICYLIYYHALAHLPATRVSAFSYLQPVIAAYAGWLVLAEPVTAGVLIATALVLGGVWVTSRG